LHAKCEVCLPSFAGSGGQRQPKVACLGNPDPVGIKVYCPMGKETFDDETTKEAPPG
jgi:hypothetical protein